MTTGNETSASPGKMIERAIFVVLGMRACGDKTIHLMFPRGEILRSSEGKNDPCCQHSIRAMCMPTKP